MYYLKYNEDNILYYCRNCGYEDLDIVNQNLSIFKIDIKNSNLDKSKFINQYTKYDPTLPRINTIPCPNNECKTNTENEPRNIISIRYDETNMKYIYLCCTCDYSWELNN
jgi:DNA-directed RNA polymerase subunit M/transcription elongation factor TFIIS